MSSRRAVLVGAFLAACGGGQPSAPSTPMAPAPPPHVTIEIVDAVIAPAKLNNAPWDGFGGAVPDSLVREVVKNALAAAKVASPLSGIIASFAPVVARGFDPPDPKGSVRVFSGGFASNPILLPKIQDTYTPAWNPPAAFSGIVLDDRATIELSLTDSDLEYDDPIATVHITAAQLQDALNRGQGAVVHVDVHDQNAQLLLVGISVLRE